MTNAQLISLLTNEVMPAVQKDSSDPGTVMLKTATNHNMSPAQLERMVDLFNTYKGLAVLEKSSNKGSVFSLVAPKDVLDKYTTYTPPTQETSERFVDDVWGDFFKDDSLSKAASANEVVHSRFPSFEENLFDKKASSAVMGEASDFTATRKWEEYDRRLEVIEENIERVSELSTYASISLQKQANDLSTRFNMEDDAWVEVSRDAYDLLTEPQQTLQVAENCLKQYGDGVKSASQESIRKEYRVLAHDRHAVLPVLQDMYDSWNILNNAPAAIDALKKQAAEVRDERDKERKSHSGWVPVDEDFSDYVDDDDEREFWEAQGGEDVEDDIVLERGNQKPKPEQKSTIPDPGTGREMFQARNGKRTAIKEPVELDKHFLEGMKSPFFKGPETMTGWNSKLMSTIQGMSPKVDKRRALVDAAIGEAKAESVWQDLITSDPIISQSEDKSGLREVFDSIRNMNPEVAGDKVILRMQLREAMQYDNSLPQQTASGLLEARKTLAQARKDEASLKDNAYKI